MKHLLNTINNSDLKQKLGLIVYAIAIPVILVSYVFDTVREIAVQRAEQEVASEQFMNLTLQMISNSKTEDQVVEALQSIKFETFPQIKFFRVTSKDSIHVFKYMDDVTVNSLESIPIKYYHQRQTFELSNGLIFYCDLVSDYNYFNLRFWIYVVYMIVVFAIVLLLVTSISRKLLGQYIVQPIINLSSVIDHISSEADYSIKMNYHRNDEIGVLYEKFNALVDTIRLRQEAMHGVVGKLKESESKFRNMADLSPIAMFETTVDGTVSFMNRIGMSSFGFKEDDIDAHEINIKQLLLSKNDEELALFDFNSDKDSQVRALHAKGIRKSGKEFHVNVFITPIYKDSLFCGIRGVIIDITERMIMINNLRKAKLDAEESDKLKSAFLANMSHEIRTPMNSIIGFADMLTDEHITQEERQEFIGYINNSSKALMNLIDDIIDIAKIEAGQIQILESEFCLHSLLDELAAFAINECKRLDKECVTVQLFKTRQESPIIQSDPFRLRQIISNLLVNAIKFTDEGYIEFGYMVESRNGKKNISIYVKDTGIGIPKDKQEEVFERFTKVSNSKQKLYGGTGLGLAICKKLAVLLGGDISLSSVEGEGSHFVLTIPLIQQSLDTDESLELISNPESIMETNWNDKTILIAEDEETNYKFIKAALRKTGAKLIWVQNGKLALEECLSNSEIDLVLMDMKMPIMNGFEATKQIRIQLESHIPIIAQTAFAMAGEKEKSFEAGCDGYLTKPIKPKELLELIRQNLQ